MQTRKKVHFTQRTITWITPFLLFFAFVYSLNQSNDTELVLLPYTDDEIVVIDSLKEKGFTNPLTHVALSIAVELGFDINPGAFVLKKGMGPIQLMAALSSPEYTYIAFHDGLRKEQVTNIFGDKLEWTEEERELFANNNPHCSIEGLEGYFHPGKYLIHKQENPLTVRDKMREELRKYISRIENGEDSKKIEENMSELNIRQILTIASLIQREAAGKHDMSLVSGVIWNRIKKDMPLQIDATLQYARANESIGWWPPVRSKDKYIDSPYNTYKYNGLPPAPIANPGKEAIKAALKPEETGCLFYIHDRSRVIHCASTYEQHKQNINTYLR